MLSGGFFFAVSGTAILLLFFLLLLLLLLLLSKVFSRVFIHDKISFFRNNSELCRGEQAR